MKIIVTIFISLLATFACYGLLAGLIALLFGVSFIDVTNYPAFVIGTVFSIIPLLCCIGEEVYKQLEKYTV